MTLEQLRIFVAVAEREHVTRAAEALNLAQSAVSASIAALEDGNGTKLFHRVGRGIQLTDAGKIFLGEAKAVLARAQTARQVLCEFGGLTRGTLRMHASQTIASYWLPRFLVKFRQTYPQISLELDVGNTAQVADAIRSGAAELGFVEGRATDDMLESEIVAHDRLVLVVGNGHEWVGRKRLQPAQLLQTAWVRREAGSGTRSEFENALTAMGLNPNDLTTALVLPSNEAVRSAVEAGAGAAAISASVAAPSLEAGLLHLVPFALPERAFFTLRHREHYRSHAAEALLKIISGGRKRTQR